MKEVQPIKDRKKIKKMQDYLKSKSERNYLLFQLGIYSGFRISDILNLKVKDLKGETHFRIKTKKTGKTMTLKIQKELKKDIDNYIKDKNDDEYLFKSQKGSNKPISRVHAWEILNEAAKKVGIRNNIGTHTLRKSFGYFMFQHTGDIAFVQKFLGHTTPDITLRYIGIEQEDLDEAIDSFKIV